MPCVIAVKKDSLMSQILQDLIGNPGSGISLIHSNANTLDELIDEIIAHGAGVIVIEKSNPFAEEASVSRLLTMMAKLLVIVVSENTNWLSVFSRNEKLLASSGELIDMIHSTHPP